jgi:hypothetical protein
MKMIVILTSVPFLIGAWSGSIELSPEDIQANISVGTEQTLLVNPTSTYTKRFFFETIDKVNRNSNIPNHTLN